MVSDVFNMDCVEYMRTLPDNHFDIAICDPPYGDADSGNFHLGGAVWRLVRPLQAADCGFTEATDGIATSSHKLPPHQQQADWNPHTRRNLGDKVQKNRQSRLRHSIQTLFGGGYKLTASYNALTGMLPHHKSSLMSFSA